MEEHIDVPARPLRPPHRRHAIRAVTQRTRVRAVNTVAESWVDMRADVEAINRGSGVRYGDTWLIDGRTYGVKQGDMTYPVSGPGLHQLSRRAYQALGVYNTFGVSPRAEEILDRMGVAETDRDMARRVWQAEAEGHG